MFLTLKQLHQGVEVALHLFELVYRLILLHCWQVSFVLQERCSQLLLRLAL